QVWDHVPARLIADDDPGEFGGQIVGLGDHPDASLRSVRAAHNAADVVAVDGDLVTAALLGKAGMGNDCKNKRCRDDRLANSQPAHRPHFCSPKADARWRAPSSILVSWPASPIAELGRSIKQWQQPGNLARRFCQRCLAARLLISPAKDVATGKK